MEYKVADILRSAMAYRQRLTTEIKKVDDFLRFSEQLLRMDDVSLSPKGEVVTGLRPVGESFAKGEGGTGPHLCVL